MTPVSASHHTDTVITVDQLAKTYGNHPAILDVSYTVQRATIVGFLGPNGAGKTTTLRGAGPEAKTLLIGAFCSSLQLVRTDS